MSLLLQALSWNYVLVTALISSILSQMIKVLLNLIIVGKFIPERMWGRAECPAHIPPQSVPWWWLRGVIAAPIPPFSQSR